MAETPSTSTRPEGDQEARSREARLAFRDVIARALGDVCLGEEDELERAYLRLSGKNELSETERRSLEDARGVGDDPYGADSYYDF